MLIKPGTFICFQGTLGAGKTLTMTRLGAMAYASGQSVAANYNTVFATEIQSISHLFELRNCVLLLDELQSILDSREFKGNAGLTQWILIVRKLGLSILYTTQFLGQVDIRVRHVTEYIYCCEKSSYHGMQATKCTMLKWGGEAGKVAKIFVMPHTKALYALYDSYDYRVRLTATGRESSFDKTAVLGQLEAAPAKPAGRKL